VAEMVSIHRAFVKLKKNNSLKKGRAKYKNAGNTEDKKKIFLVKKDWPYFF